MTSAEPSLVNNAILMGSLALALLFKPWAPLRHAPLQNPWLGAMVILPGVWWTERLLPNGMGLHVGGACLLVLMFGWPLAMWSLLPIGLGAALIEARTWWPEHLDWNALIAHIVWRGTLPATLGLAMGLAVRRFLPKHIFVYILGRGFFVTALAVTAAGFLGVLAGQKPQALASEEWLLAHWLLGWGEAISTGMLTAIFVAFKPEWMLTYSDQRYLPGAKGRSER